MNAMQQRLSIAATSRKLGDVAARTGDLNMALDLLEESLQMQRSVHGEGAHPDIAVTLSQLGDVTAQTGDLKKSLQYLEASLRMQYSLHGEIDHPDIATTLRKLGDVTSQTADLKKAKEYLEASLKMQLALYRGALPPGPAAAAEKVQELSDSLHGRLDEMETKICHRVEELVDSLHGRLDVLDRIDGWVIGTEIWSDQTVAFKHEGCNLDSYMTLYQVIKTEDHFRDARVVLIDPMFPPIGSRLTQKQDFGFAHDVCCGLGGFATALDFLGCQVVSAVDWSSHAMETYLLNHDAMILRAAIGDVSTVYKMHCAQKQKGVQPMLLAGYPCQPFSDQGHQLGSLDVRSRTLPEVLTAAVLVRACAVVLECVPAALTNPFVQEVIHDYAAKGGFRVVQRVLDLHSVWPSRRSRCFTVLVPLDLRDFDVPALPVLSPAPCVGDVIPASWPAWSPEDEAALKWTDQELDMYHDPRFGNPHRKVNASQPLRTALHSWGSPLEPCPCQCRSQGFSISTLLSRGLRGVEITSSVFPYHSRYIHPCELQLLLGFPPIQAVHDHCKLQLALFGNSVSPIQVLWILVHLFQAVGTCPVTLKPSELLSNYLASCCANEMSHGLFQELGLAL